MVHTIAESSKMARFKLKEAERELALTGLEGLDLDGASGQASKQRQSYNVAREDEEAQSEAIASRLEAIGFHVGSNLAER